MTRPLPLARPPPALRTFGSTRSYIDDSTVSPSTPIKTASASSLDHNMVYMIYSWNGVLTTKHSYEAYRCSMWLFGAYSITVEFIGNRRTSWSCLRDLSKRVFNISANKQ